MVDDPAAAARAHVRYRLSAHAGEEHERHLYRLLPQVLAGMLCGPGRGSTRVVDDDVHAPESVGSGTDEVLDSREARQVTCDGEDLRPRLGANLLSRLAKRIRVPAAYGHPGALPREAEGTCLAKAFAGTAHDGDFFVQAEAHLRPPQFGCASNDTGRPTAGQGAAGLDPLRRSGRIEGARAPRVRSPVKNATPTTVVWTLVRAQED